MSWKQVWKKLLHTAHRSSSDGGFSQFQSFHAGIHCFGYLRILTHRTATTQVQAPQAEVVPASVLSRALCKPIQPMDWFVPDLHGRKETLLTLGPSNWDSVRKNQKQRSVSNLWPSALISCKFLIWATIPNLSGRSYWILLPKVPKILDTLALKKGGNGWSM